MQRDKDTLIRLKATENMQNCQSDGKMCLACGCLGANINIFTRLGDETSASEPLINVLSCILKISTIEIQLHSDIVCEKCFKILENIVKLQYKLSQECRTVIKNFNSAIKAFNKSNKAEVFDENQCLLVLNNSSLKTNESGIIGRAISQASMRKKEGCPNAKPEKKHKCTVCGKAFRAYSHKVEHMVTHTFEKSFKCDMCGFETTTKSNLNKHKQKHTHEFICLICNKKLSNSFSLKDHMATHRKDRSFQCSYCDKSFTRLSSKKIHEKNHMLEYSSFECKVCFKRFALQSRLDRHMLIHSEEKQFACSICFRKFARKDDLKGHERVHSGEKPYSCNECGKEFRYVSNLKNHMKLHDKDNKPYKCTCCNVSFSSEAKYESHLKTRNHKRKISDVPSAVLVHCDKCHYSFTVDDYALHRPICGKEKETVQDQCEELLCGVCHIGFENLDLLSEHMLQCHIDQSNDQKVFLSTVDEDNSIVDLAPLKEFTGTSENGDVVVTVGTDDNLHIPTVQNVSPAPHSLNFEF